MAESVEKGLFGVHAPWRSDPIKFKDDRSFEIVRGSAPGYYKYSVDGVVCSKQVDAVQLIEWKMAEAFSSDLILPESKLFRLTGSEAVMRDFIDESGDYLVERNGSVLLVNDYYLYAEKLAEPGDAVVEEGKRQVAHLYEGADKPWIDDCIKFVASDAASVKKAVTKGKYIVDRHSGYTVVYSASRLITDGLAVKDSAMFDEYFRSKATSKKWTAKKTNAFFEMFPIYAREIFGYDDSDGNISSLYEAALFYLRATDCGNKKGKNFAAWAKNVFDKEKSDMTAKSESAKTVGTVISLVSELAQGIKDDATLIMSEWLGMKLRSSVNGKLDYRLFFAHAMREALCGSGYGAGKKKNAVGLYVVSDFEKDRKINFAKRCDDVPLVKIFDDARWQETSEKAEKIKARADMLKEAVESVNKLVKIVGDSVTDVPKDSNFLACAAYLEKRPKAETKEELKSGEYEQMKNLVDEALTAVGSAGSFISGIGEYARLLRNAWLDFRCLDTDAKKYRKRKPFMLFAKSVHKPFEKKDRPAEYSGYKLVYICNRYEITRCFDRTIKIVGTEFSIPSGSCYYVSEKKSGKKKGLFSEEALVYCGLAEWRK